MGLIVLIFGTNLMATGVLKNWRWLKKAVRVRKAHPSLITQGNGISESRPAGCGSGGQVVPGASRGLFRDCWPLLGRALRPLQFSSRAMARVFSVSPAEMENLALIEVSLKKLLGRPGLPVQGTGCVWM